MNPRLLLLEDDAVSAAFLVQALAALPARVELAANLASARALACAGQALWLFDARLPDGHGAELLGELRRRGLGTPALALTAEDQPQALRQLREYGFLDVLTKPIRAETLRDVVARHLAPAAGLPRWNNEAVRRHLVPSAAAPRWNNEAALAALGGNRESMHSLRGLFLRELPGQGRLVHAALARGDHAAAREQLHRLKAGCGFVGAATLLAAVRALSATPADAAALKHFLACADDLIQNP